MLKRSLSVFMDVWFEDGTTQGVESPFALLTRVNNANSGYGLSLLFIASRTSCL